MPSGYKTPEDLLKIDVENLSIIVLRTEDLALLDQVLAIRVTVAYKGRSDLNNNFELQVVFDSEGPQFTSAIDISSLPLGDAAKGYNFTLPDILFGD